MSSYTEQKFEFKGAVKSTSLALAVVGFIALGVSFALNPTVGWVDYLTNGVYLSLIAASSIFFLAVAGIMQTSWMTPYRRIPEAMVGFLPIAMVMMLVLFFGLHTLYEWTHHDVVMNDPILVQKTPWLNTPGFMIRMIVIFSVWIGVGLRLRSLSLKQDKEGQSESLTNCTMRFSAVGMILFGLTICLAGFDWVMSLEPHWFSTIFGVYTFAGSFVAGVSFITLVVIALKNWGYLQGVVNDNHLHDLGKWMFGMSTFWAYIWVSQYLLIWYANIPEETEYYVMRSHGVWGILFFANVIINWVFPFFALMTRAAKRNTKRLALVAVVLLAGRFLDLYLMIAPKVFEHHHTHITGFGALQLIQWAGMMGLFVFIVLSVLSKQSLVPVKDPNLDEGVHLHQ